MLKVRNKMVSILSLLLLIGIVSLDNLDNNDNNKDNNTNVTQSNTSNISLSNSNTIKNSEYEPQIELLSHQYLYNPLDSKLPDLLNENQKTEENVNENSVFINESAESENLKKEEESDDTHSEEVLPSKEKEESIPMYTIKHVPSNNSFKSYMPYTAITNKSSNQFKLQQQAYTNNLGLRMVGDRYCVALGSFYTSDIGTKVDIIMKNGNVIKSILADQKADIHTDSSNIRAQDGSVVEFVVDKNALHKDAKVMGDISHADDKFKGEIKEIRVYE